MAPPKYGVSANDAVLLVALLYLIADITCEWDNFAPCHQPIHKWLFISYGSVLACRVMHLFGAHLSKTSPDAKDNFLLNLREKGMVSWMIMTFTWTVALPFCAVWTGVGTMWLYSVRTHTPQCLPPSQCWWFIYCWLAVSYLWVFIHLFLGGMAGTLELRVRRAERRLRQIEDSDLISRWGVVSQLSGYDDVKDNQDKGLTPEEIALLPAGVAPERTEGCKTIECAICLCDVAPGENIRTMTHCGHTFHRSCIDVWLLRNADCPLCKRSARPTETENV